RCANPSTPFLIKSINVIAGFLHKTSQLLTNGKSKKAAPKGAASQQGGVQDSNDCAALQGFVCLRQIKNL
ncbi:MAG: hypothetical protein AAGK57_13880, partial [Pseudomonadota bacterium]